MDAVLRAATIYVFLFVIMRAAGKRTFAQITPFDFILLLIIGEATQQGLLGEDFSVTHALIVITTLVSIDVAVAALQRRWPRFSKVVEGVPLVLVDHGEPITDRLRRTRIDEQDILEHARERRGIEHLGQIKYAVLERGGQISIVPYEDTDAPVSD